MQLSLVYENGFPPGYFILRSVACDRVLDVEKDSYEDDAPVCLYPSTESSLVESFRVPTSNNQVFFIDTAGALCSRSSGHAIDVDDGRLVLRHRRPVSQPYPNKYSHSLPSFHYDASTGHVTVTYASDPAYPDGTNPSGAWRERTYYLTSIPERKPRSVLDDAAEALERTLRSPLSLFSGLQAATTVPEAAFDLREDEIEEQERAEEAEIDDAVDKVRKVRVVGTTVEEDRRLGARARERRVWEVLPLRTVARKTV
ncbi:hypothetical protein K488DRAFT_52469 [Vararia minispora EC-137]|uniref:Uncharacterized protein n=1 Tax=Vararia minispora EC-137 TaxID=1314806 RepID=A0ACB8QHD4_9AGAM|nr:hypothetical protein K488DRAFT_52469 [Vararia minispora EC-137]